MTPRPGTKLHKAAQVVALAWILGMGYFGVPEAARQIHDGFTLQSCALAAAQAIEDRQVGMAHLPDGPNDGLDVILDYAIGFEQVFSDRIAVMDCPSSVSAQLTNLRNRHAGLLAYLRQIKENPEGFDGFILNRWTSMVSQSLSDFTSALAALLPKLETNDASQS